MRQLLVVVVVSLAMALSAHAQSTGPHLKDGPIVPAPLGFVSWCANGGEPLRKQQCQKPAVSTNTPKSDLFVAQFINKSTNNRKGYLSDLGRNGMEDAWQEPEAANEFDCEEFALLKQRLLLRQGFSAASLRLALVMDDKRRFSMVLDYVLPDADYILDHRNNDLLKWSETGYYFLARQSERDPKIWQSLGWAKGGAKSAAKEPLRRPFGKDWTSCVLTADILPLDILNATSPAPREGDGPLLGSSEQFFISGRAFEKKWKGYKPASKINDAIVKQWSKNIFRFYSFGQRKPGEKPWIIDLQDKRKTVKGSGKVAGWMREWQLATCRRQKLNKCPVFSEVSAGTAFKLGQDTYYTCRHNMGTWVTWASELNGRPQSEIAPPLKITVETFGKLSRFLYDSAAPGKQKFTIKLFDPDPNLKMDIDKQNPMTYSEENYIQRATDVLVFGLTGNAQKMETADQVHFADLKPGEGVFQFGYPGEIKLFPKTGGNSDGKRLYVSHGTILGDTEYYGDRGRMAAFNTFGFPGNSGGPVVSEAGKLVGMVCYAGVRERNLEDSVSFVTTSDLALIRQWWDELPPAPASTFKVPAVPK